MIDKDLEQRVAQFERTFRQIITAVEGFNKDILKSISALRDGYPEHTIVSCGSIAESILKRIWIKEKIKGNPAEKTLEPLMQVLKDYIERLIYDYLRDIQVARNRAAHGEIILEEDAVEVLRKLSIVINWYLTKYESPKQGDDSEQSFPPPIELKPPPEPVPPLRIEPRPPAKPTHSTLPAEAEAQRQAEEEQKRQAEAEVQQQAKVKASTAVRNVIADVPNTLDAAVLRGLALDLKKQPASAEAFQRQLADALPEPAASLSPPPLSRAWRRIIGGIAVAALAVGVGWNFMRPVELLSLPPHSDTASNSLAAPHLPQWTPPPAVPTPEPTSTVPNPPPVSEPATPPKPEPITPSEPVPVTPTIPPKPITLPSRIELDTIERLVKAAQMGDAASQVQLGWRWLTGRERAQSDVDAVYWFDKAAAQGDPNGKIALAGMHLLGRGVVTTDVKAARALLTSIRPADWPASEKWLKTTVMSEAEKGDIWSQLVLAETDYYVAKNYAEAAKWYRKAAQQENTLAQYSLGSLYYKGEGVAKDYKEAGRWFGKAAYQGHLDAQTRLGVMHFETQSYPEAAEWLSKAAQRGSPIAQFHLGGMYFYGMGLPKNNLNAYAWFKLAALNKLPKANEFLKLVSKKMTAKDIQEAEQRAQQWKVNQR